MNLWIKFSIKVSKNAFMNRRITDVRNRRIEKNIGIGEFKDEFPNRGMWE